MGIGAAFNNTAMDRARMNYVNKTIQRRLSHTQRMFLNEGSVIGFHGEVDFGFNVGTTTSQNYVFLRENLKLQTRANVIPR